jgi:aryl-alcohol dehydrogenase-like predicted oxidoreductase
VPACLRFGVGVIPYFPLAAGLLTGKYRRGEPAPPGTRLVSWPAAPLESAPWDRVEAIGSFAASRGVGMLEVVIGGLAAMPAVATVIAGASTPEQVQANVKASDWEPSAADLAELDTVSPPG